MTISRVLLLGLKRQLFCNLTARDIIVLMPFVPKTELQTLQSENARLSQEVAAYDEMRPHIELAVEIRDTIVNMLGGGEDLTAQQIGEMAYQKVLRERVGEARDEVAARYESEHRRSLYERVLGTIAVEEGDKISDRVKEKVETDPVVSKELKDSARRELAARAKNVIRDKVNAEQSAIIDAEAERQVALDHLDVRLAVDHELDLSEEAVKKLVEPGDKLELFFETHPGQRQRIFLVWTKDAKGQEGWMFDGTDTKLFTKSNSGDINMALISQDKFVTIGCINKDLEQGLEVMEPDKLTVGLPIVLMQKQEGKLKPIKIKTAKRGRGSYSAQTYEPCELTGADFQTKTIEFVSTSASKKLRDYDR
jgi:hypothetical protein